MTRRQFLQISAALGAGSLLANFSVAGKNPGTGKKNVLWIVVDDMGFGDLTSTGAKGYATPNIDRIGKEGVTLHRSYVYPVCTATRTAFLTGHSPQIYSGMEGVLLPGYELGLPEDSICAAKEFKADGYRTALIGKWHLGDQPQSHPNNQGFEDFYGFLWGETDYFKHTKKVGGKEVLDFYQNGKKEDIEGYTTDLYTDKAISFLDEKDPRPFFLLLAYNAPHYYLAAPQALREKYPDNSEEALYAAVMDSLDTNIGRVLDAIDRLGLADDTLVVFTTDNGAPEKNGSNAPFKGHKNSLDEGGIRSPLMARLPGVIPPGLRSDEVFSAPDLLPTSLALAGAKTRTSFEGKDLQKLFTTDGATNPDARCFRYKKSEKIQRAVVKKQWKLIYRETTGTTELFDVEKDPGESVDRAAEHPQIVSELKGEWNRWSAKFTPDLGVW